MLPQDVNLVLLV